MMQDEFSALVDCGSSNSEYQAGNVAADYLESAGYRALNQMILTHAHADHTNGLEELLERMEVHSILLPDKKEWEQSISLLHQKSLITEVKEVKTVQVGDICFTIYPPIGDGDGNEAGLSILISRREFDFLITGDMPSSQEEQLMELYGLPDLELLIVGHHGAKSSTSRDLLLQTNPEAAIISVGRNSYGHPAEEVLYRLTDGEINVYRTDLQGNIHIEVN